MDAERHTAIALCVERLLTARNSRRQVDVAGGDGGRTLQRLIAEELLEGSDKAEGRRRIVRSGLILGIPLRQLETELDRLENLR